ncbi:MAG: hypothetical protein QW673_00685 [Candidatus Thermoplasmatota archaeon]
MKPDIIVKVGSSWSDLATKNFIVEKLNIKISRNATYQTASLKIKDKGIDWESLDIGKRVQILINGVEEFRGYIKEIERTRENNCLTLNVLCAGLTYDLYRYITDEEKTFPAGKTTGEIAAELYTTYIAPNETWTNNITTATGVTFDKEAIFDQWKLGDCFEYLVNADGYIFFVDWDSTNNRKRINYLLPQEPATPLKFSDDISDNPDRLILNASVNFNDEIKNYVILKGNKNFKYILKQENGGAFVFGVMPGYFYKVAQVFKAPQYTKLSAVKIKGCKQKAEADYLQIKIYKALYNIATDATITANKTPTSGSLENIKDNNNSTFASFNLAAGETLEIKLDFGISKDIAYTYVGLGDFADLDVDVLYSQNDSTYYEFASNISSSSFQKKTTFTSARYWKLKITNNASSSKTVTVYSFATFARGFSNDRWCVGMDTKSEGEAFGTLPTSTSEEFARWSGWIFFDKPVELEANSYYVLSVEYHKNIDDVHYILEASTDAYSDGKILRFSRSLNDWNLENLAYDLTFQLGFNYENISAKAENISSQATYGKIVTKITNPFLISQVIAEKIANYLANTFSMPSCKINIEVEGVNGLDLSKKVKIYLRSLSKSNDLVNKYVEIISYEHEILPGQRWRTYLELGDPQSSFTSIIGKLMKGLAVA